MKVINENHEVITDYDLNKGFLSPCLLIRSDAVPLSKEKTVWADEDWEEVQVYHLYEWAREENIETLRADIIQKMSEQCEKEIIQGITINNHKFSLEYSDQIAMMKILMNIQLGATQVQWHPDNEDCMTYSAEEFSVIAAKADAHVTWHQTYFNSLKKYIKNIDSVDELVNVNYGTEIPEEYQTDALKALIAMRDENDNEES